MDWSHIVELHGPTVWRISRRLLNNESDAADCFQQTFVSALELLRREPVANWGALLNRLAHARALDRLRQRQRQSKRQAIIPDEGIADLSATSPPQAAEAREFAQQLREALADLDPRQGEVFCLPRHYGSEVDLSLVDPDGGNVVTLLTEKVDPRDDGIELVAWR
jgi:RNA polymerase sigma-70 factor (ECF subfamily)